MWAIIRSLEANTVGLRSNDTSTGMMDEFEDTIPGDLPTDDSCKLSHIDEMECLLCCPLFVFVTACDSCASLQEKSWIRTVNLTVKECSVCQNTLCIESIRGWLRAHDSCSKMGALEQMLSVNEDTMCHSKDEEPEEKKTVIPCGDSNPNGPNEFLRGSVAQACALLNSCKLYMSDMDAHLAGCVKVALFSKTFQKMFHKYMKAAGYCVYPPVASHGWKKATDIILIYLKFPSKNWIDYKWYISNSFQRLNLFTRPMMIVFSIFTILIVHAALILNHGAE